MENIFLEKILDNIESEGCEKGIIIASPSKNNPDYYYHWIRDSAIVIRSLVKSYEKNKSNKLKEIILNYVTTEIDLQNTKTLSGLGEPKFNVDKTSFNDNWGRPQNDGPALRVLAFLDILNKDILELSYNNYKKIVHDILYKNIIYICDNIHNPCFDLWEENLGFHLYTRLVQTKALKEYLKIYKGINFAYLLQKYKELKVVLSHHLKYEVISSFNQYGKVSRIYDSSVLLGICHIDFDNNLIDLSDPKISNYIYDLENIFRKKYIINEKYYFTFLGRYDEDCYYNGQIWYICTIGLLRILNYLKRKEKVKYFLNFIKELDDNNLSEQLEDTTLKSLSADNLTWNYSELYNLIIEYK